MQTDSATEHPGQRPMTPGSLAAAQPPSNMQAVGGSTSGPHAKKWGEGQGTGGGWGGDLNRPTGLPGKREEDWGPGFDSPAGLLGGCDTRGPGLLLSEMGS